MTPSILVADDEKIVNDLLKLFLEQAGLQVFSAFTGKEALEIIRHKKP
jgi:CheY-like chemotaxis protein